MDPNYEGGSRLKKNADPDPVAKLMRIRERYSEKQVFSPTNLWFSFNNFLSKLKTGTGSRSRIQNRPTIRDTDLRICNTS